MAKTPAEFDFQHPVASKRNKHPGTTADVVVDHLCHPEKVVAITDDTYTLRMWMSIIVQNCCRIDRKGVSLAQLLGIPKDKIYKGVTNCLDPASVNFLAAVD